MRANQRGVNEWAKEIELRLSIFAMSIFEVYSIGARTMYLFDRSNRIAIMID